MRLRFLVLLSGICCLIACRPAEPIRPPRPGEPAPKLRLDKLLQAPQGAITEWKHLRGKTVVIEFWATSCGPCVAGIPHLNRLVDQFKDKPVQFISITDEPESLIARFLKRKPMGGWIGIDSDGSTKRAYGVRGLPHTVLVDGNGIVVAHTLLEQVTAQILDEILAGKTPDLPPFDPAFDSAAQATRPPPEPALFKLAISPSREPHAPSGHSRRDNHQTAKGWDLQVALSYAYDIRTARVLVDGPLAEQRYDLELTWPPGKEEMLKLMLRDALAASAGFAARVEHRETDVYVLTVRPGTEETLRPTASTGGSSSSQSPGRMSAVNKSMDDLSSSLEPIFERPVLDETGLAGRYDWELTWDSEHADSLIAALDQELGLQLTTTKRSVEVLVLEPVTDPGPSLRPK